MRVIDAGGVRAALPFGRLIEALRAQFIEGCVVPDRHVHRIGPGPDGEGGLTSLVMPAWSPGRYYGIKVINVAPDNVDRGLPGLHASYLLHDADTGAPLALIDGDELTARRTAAASALAASFLARDGASRLLVLGAGRIARLLPEAHRAVRPLTEVRVWSRRPEQALQLAEQWRQSGRPDAGGMGTCTVRPVLGDGDALDEAMAHADIVSTATLATDPVVRGRALRAGSHLDLIGSFTPAMREADDAAFAGARVFVDTPEALRKSGDLLGPISRGVLAADAVQGTLATLCRGEATGRRHADERTVFKSVGTALEDLAAATLVFDTVTAGGR